MEHAPDSPGSLLVGMFIALLLVGCSFGLGFVALSAMRAGGEQTLLKAVWSLSWVGTVFYGIGRVLVMLPGWRPKTTAVFSSKRIVHFAFNFVAVSIGTAPAGVAFGLLKRSGASQAWEWPTLAIALVGGHFAWNAANRRAVELMRLLRLDK